MGHIRLKRFVAEICDRLRALRQRPAAAPEQPRDVLRLGLELNVPRHVLTKAVGNGWAALEKRGAVLGSAQAQRFASTQADWLDGIADDDEWLAAVNNFFAAAFDADPAVRSASREIHLAMYSSDPEMYEAEAALDAAYADARETVVEALREALEQHDRPPSRKPSGPYR